MLRDNDFGIVRVRAFGTYDFKIVEPKTFLREVAGSDHNFRLDEFADTMRSRIVSIFTDAIASAKIPVLDVAARYTELGDALLPLINPAVTAKYGLEITSFIVENVSVPPEVEQAIDKRSSMAAIGNLNDFVKYQMGKGFESGSGGGGPAGTAAELAVGFGLAQQMMQQGFAGGQATPTVAPRRRRRRRRAARAAQSGRRRAGARRVGSRRDGGARVRRAQGQEDRIVVAHLARRVDDIHVLMPLDTREVEGRRGRRDLRAREARVPGVRRAGGVESVASRNWSARSAAPSRRIRSIATTGKVAELDLVAALRELPDDERGWQADRGAACSARAASAVMVFDADRVGQNCEFCGSPALVGYDEIKSPIRPQGVLPFRIDRQPRPRRHPPLVAQQVARARPAGEGGARRHRPQPLHSVLDVRCAACTARGTPRRATTTTSDVEGRDSKGNRVMRQERRVRWEPASGVVDHVFDDEPVPGTQGLPLDLLRQVEPFPTQEVVPYDTAFLSGHVVEHYQVVLIDAAKQSQEQMHAALERLCAQQVPGDTHRNLRIHPDRSRAGRSSTCSCRSGCSSYNYGARAFQVVVNGYTGKIAGTLSVQRLEDRPARASRDRRRADPGDVEFEVTLQHLAAVLSDGGRALCLTPGPAVLLVVSMALTRGSSAGFGASLGSSRRTGSISRSQRPVSALCCSRPQSSSPSSSGPARRT